MEEEQKTVAGRGRPKVLTEDAKHRSFYLTDDETVKVRKFIQDLRSNKKKKPIKGLTDEDQEKLLHLLAEAGLIPQISMKDLQEIKKSVANKKRSKHEKS